MSDSPDPGPIAAKEPWLSRAPLVLREPEEAVLCNQRTLVSPLPGSVALDSVQLLHG